MKKNMRYYNQVFSFFFLGWGRGVWNRRLSSYRCCTSKLLLSRQMKFESKLSETQYHYKNIRPIIKVYQNWKCTPTAINRGSSRAWKKIVNTLTASPLCTWQMCYTIAKKNYEITSAYAAGGVIYCLLNKLTKRHHLHFYL